MPKTGVVLRRAVTIMALVVIAACSPVFNYHGYIPPKEDLDEISVGLDTRDTVEAIFGKPGASGLLSEGAWYYVRSEFKHEGWKAPEEIDRQVVAISFDEEGVVSNIERFGLERGEVVVLERRVTDSNLQGISFLRQLFGNTSGASNIGQFFQ